tara:strand:- start:611 stop:1303 length:693 start_codon:yes stop_codon:yes gene_type:complete
MSRKIRDTRNIPIVINNFNRFTYLKQQIERFEALGYTNIYIIDNQSTYPPLLKYYDQLPYTIFRLNKNVGHLSLWKTIIFKWFEHDYYVYTDPDIYPGDDCPDNFMEYFKSILNTYPEYSKVGFALAIDDLPDHFDDKQKVKDWEDMYWQMKMQADTEIYIAKIDTTFALYRPGAKGGWWVPAMRVAGKYTARHLPWYRNSSVIDEEEQYFIEHASGSSSWYKRTQVYES